MITRVSSHQPSFFPWAGYWNKFARSDVHILSCGVQFDYGGYQNRVQLGDFWAVLPVEGNAKHKLLKDVRYKPEALPKLFKTFRQALTGKRWPGRNQVHCVLDNLEFMTEARDEPMLREFNVDALSAFALCTDNIFPAKAPVVEIDDTQPDEHMTKTERLVARVRRHVPEGRIQYLAGSGALGYLYMEALPDDFELLVQKPKEGAPPGTILQSIAQGDVAEAISDRWFEWVSARPMRAASVA